VIPRRKFWDRFAKTPITNPAIAWTLRGSAYGIIRRILDDGRVVWQPEGTQSELTALPESLLREKKSPRQ